MPNISIVISKNIIAALRAVADIINKLSSMLKTLGAIISAAFLGVLKHITTNVFAASNKQEIISKFTAVFKSLDAPAKKWITSVADNIKFAESTIMDIITSFQDTLQPIGFDSNKSFKMSKELTKLSIDLMSFSSKIDDPADSARDLISILTGSHEVAKKYGVIINEMKLNTTLLAMGIKGGYKAASEMDKVLARATIMMEGTSAAQGNFAVSVNTFKQSLMSLKEKLKEYREQFGEALLEPLTITMRFLGYISEIINDILKDNPKIAKTIAMISLSGVVIGPVLISLGLLISALSGYFSPLGLLFNFVSRKMYDLLKSSRGFTRAAKNLGKIFSIEELKSNFENLINTFRKFVNKLSEDTKLIFLSTFEKMSTYILDFAQSVFDSIIDIMYTMADPIINILNNLMTGITGAKYATSLIYTSYKLAKLIDIPVSGYIASVKTYKSTYTPEYNRIAGDASYYQQIFDQLPEELLPGRLTNEELGELSELVQSLVEDYARSTANKKAMKAGIKSASKNAIYSSIGHVIYMELIDTIKSTTNSLWFKRTFINPIYIPYIYIGDDWNRVIDDYSRMINVPRLELNKFKTDLSKFKQFISKKIEKIKKQLGGEQLRQIEMQFGSVNNFIKDLLKKNMEKEFEYDSTAFDLDKSLLTKYYAEETAGMFGTSGNLAQQLGTMNVRYEDKIISERKKTDQIKDWHKSIRYFDAVSPGIGIRRMT